MRVMRGSKNPAIKKLRSKAGESIAETLIALLVAALALTMLAGAIFASSNIVTKSRDTLGRYYDTNEATVVGMPPTEETATIHLESSAGDGTDPSYISTDTHYTVYCYENAVFTKSPVVAYKIKIKND